MCRFLIFIAILNSFLYSDMMVSKNGHVFNFGIYIGCLLLLNLVLETRAQQCPSGYMDSGCNESKIFF